jgi:hypothetical protein
MRDQGFILVRWQGRKMAVPGTDDPWSKYIETRELAGFARPHAEAFLRRDYVDFWNVRARAA